MLHAADRRSCRRSKQRRLIAGLLCLFSMIQPAGGYAEAPVSDAGRDGDIESLTRKVQEINRELDRLKQQAPSSSIEKASTVPAANSSEPAVPSHASPPTLEHLAREFRGEFDYMNERIGVLNQHLDRRVNLSMYLTTEFEAFQRGKAEFAGAKLELFPSIKLTDRIRAFGEFEFNSTIDSGTGNPNERGKVELDQGWIEYTVNELFKARVGVVLVPFGRYNLEPFDPIQEFTARPILAKKVIPTVWSEAAAGFTGRATLGSGSGDGWFKDAAVEYQAFILNGLDNHVSDQEGLREARGSFHRDNNHNKAVVGRVLTKLRPGLEVGVSGYYGSYDNTGKKMRGVDVDLKITQGPFELLAEVASFDLDPGGRSVSPTNSSGIVPSSLRGGYIEGRYRFWFDRLKGTWLGRGFDDPKFTALIRYEQAAVANSDLPIGQPANRESRLSIGMNYRPVPTVAFKVEYQFNRTQNEPLVNGNNNGVALSVTGAF
jgi:hypothetical protein